MSTRWETQRRAAVALLAFIVVAFGLGLAVSLAPPSDGAEEATSSAGVGQRSLEAARANLERVFGDGVDLVAEDEDEAEKLLSEAYRELETAERAGISARTIGPLRAEVMAGLDRIYRVVTVEDNVVFTFDPAVAGELDLGVLVRGPDLGPYLINRPTNTVWRVDLKAALPTVVFHEGLDVGGVLTAAPRFLGVGGPDLLILDASNALWQWRPTDEVGGGTLARVNVNGAAEWGPDVIGIGTYLRDATQGLYNLYVIDPSLEQIRWYSPAAAGSGFPAPANNWLNAARDVSGVTSMYIDGDIYLSSAGQVERFSAGQIDGWQPVDPGDLLLRDAPRYTALASTTGRREGPIYAYDEANDRVIAFEKSDVDGTFIEQYRLAEGNANMADLRSMYVAQGSEGPPTLVWITATAIHFSRLAPAEVPPPSDSPVPGSAAPITPSGPPAASAPAAVAP